MLPFLQKYLSKKILLISGPRQRGKTTLAKMLPGACAYVNFDNPKDRLILEEQSWDRKKQHIIFDDLHKKDKWKSWLKGVFDSEGILPASWLQGAPKWMFIKGPEIPWRGGFFPSGCFL